MNKEYIITKMKRFCGFTAGIVFYISGILKLMDPVGAGLVMDEYFSFMHISFLDFTAKAAGTLLAFAETLIGSALITGVWRKIFAISAFAMQGAFTLLTLALVIFNPEMDCGCFGEAIHLTHLQTFLKNIVLLVLITVFFIPLKDIGEPKQRKYISFTIVSISTAAFMIYSLMYIPLVDYTDYKPTACIQHESGAGMDEDIYEALFIYEKDGKEKTFDLDNLPDSSWTFVRTETKINTKLQDQITPLSFCDSSGTYMDSLAFNGKVMVVSVYDPKMGRSKWKNICNFTSSAQKEGFTVLILASGQSSDVTECIPEQLREVIEPHLYFCDYKTLVTLNRSNGGITFFSDGYLIRKWAARSTPEDSELHETAVTAETEIIIGQSSQGSLTFQAFLLYVFAVMLLL